LVPNNFTYNVDEPCVVQFCAGVNGWSFTLRQSGNTSPLESGAYGERPGQFAQLSELWLTYRLDKITLELVPNNPGAGNQSGVFAVRDTGGRQIPYDFNLGESPITFYSRLKDVKLCPNTRTCRMAQDYRGVMTQVTDKPYR